MFSTSIRFISSVILASVYCARRGKKLLSLTQHNKAMNLAKFPVKFLIFQLIWRTCLTSITIDTSESKESSKIIKATSKVVKSCYESRVGTIGIAGNSPDSLIASLSSEESASVIVLDNFGRSVNSGPVSRVSLYKLQIFVVTTSSSTELERILVEIKKSRWWNHMANFYIIDWPVNKSECSKAYEILWTAWRMNLLEAKFMCTDRTKGRLIYSFNPYTSDAPDTWKLANTYRGINDHPWALLVRKYRDNNNICENMDFDKTKNLGGYEIRASVSELIYDVRLDVNKTGADVLGGVGGGIMRSLFRALNATIKLVIHPRTESLGFVDEKGFVHGILAATANGITDIGIIIRKQQTVINLTSIYPIYFTGLSVITQYRGHHSQLRKILSVLDVRSRIGLCLVILVTLIFFKYFVHQTRATAILNVVHMICNAAFTNLPSNVASRTYLISLFIFIVTVQGIYQGQLASLLSTQKPLKNINTMSDLAETDYTIYGYHDYRQFFTEREFEGRFVGTDDYNCTGYALRDSSAACLRVRDVLVSEAARTKLHLSSDFIINLYNTYAIREDWPLEPRINSNLQKLVEANIFYYTYDRSLDEPSRTVAANDSEDNRRGLKVFNLGDLGFAFAILGIGLTCAMISFIIEMAIGRGARRRITKIQGQRKNLFR